MMPGVVPGPATVLQVGVGPDTAPVTEGTPVVMVSVAVTVLVVTPVALKESTVLAEPVQPALAVTV
jgi:hypothetical protein